MIRLNFFADISGTRGLITKLLELQKIRKITCMHMIIVLHKFQCYYISLFLNLLSTTTSFTYFFSSISSQLFFCSVFPNPFNSFHILSSSRSCSSAYNCTTFYFYNCITLFLHFILFSLFLASNLVVRREKKAETMSCSYICL